MKVPQTAKPYKPIIKVNSYGQILITNYLLKDMNLNYGDKFYILLKDDGITLKRVEGE